MQISRKDKDAPPALLYMCALTHRLTILLSSIQCNLLIECREPAAIAVFSAEQQK